MQRVRHLGLGAFKATSVALTFILAVTVVLSAALLPWPEPALAATAVQSVEQISRGWDGSQANQNSFGGGSLSADGRYVAFCSEATNIVADDNNNAEDVFVRDRTMGQTSRVSLTYDNQEGNGQCYSPVISADGHYVAFSSVANNMVPGGDTNGKVDIFVRGLQTGETSRVSLSSDNDPANNESHFPSISGDGRYVTFDSLASNLVDDDNNGTMDVFVRDLQLGETTRVSLSSDNIEGDGQSWCPSISADGRYVAFFSGAANLVADDTNLVADVFVRDRLEDKTTRVSLAWNGDEGNSFSAYPSISADGRYVAFDSEATNLVNGDTNDDHDIFVRDRVENTTTRVSVSSSGTEGEYDSQWPRISSDGWYVSFESRSSDLVADDNNGWQDVFVHNRHTQETIVVSATPAGTLGDADSSADAYMSADGRYVSFSSAAGNLAADDGDLRTDVLLVSLSIQSGADIAVTPASYDFGAKAIGSVSNQTFIVSNNGTDNLTIESVAVADPLAAPFTIVTDGCSGQTILPGENRTLTVRFSPTAKSSFSDSFNVPSNDPDTPTVTVSLTGAVPNAAPTAPVVDVTPNSPATTAELVCSISTPSTDSDNDTIKYSYQWHKDGVAQSALITSTVAAASTTKGEVWKCVVTATDGTASVPAEDQVTIQNSAPTAPVAGVTPESADGTVDLVCTITTQSTDADGDTIKYSYQWYKDGVLQSALTTNTVAAANTADGQVWKCVVNATDGSASGPAVEDQVTVTGPGDGEPADEEPAGGFPWWAIIVTVIGLLLLIFFFIFFWRRRKKKEEEEQSASRK